MRADPDLRRPSRAGRRLAKTAWVLILFACARSSVAVPPAPDAKPLSSFEQDVITEINAARTHPDSYAALLETWKPFYQGLRVVVPHDGIEEVELTEEGAAALDEAVKALRATEALPALQLSEALCHSARDLAEAQGPTGDVGHIAPDGSDPMVRARRYFAKPKLIGEAISYGREGGKDVVRHLLVDDGVKDRGHRKSLLDPRFRFVGVACGPHTVYGTMCVIDLGDHF
jgi:uncharacterized protein YkwD